MKNNENIFVRINYNCKFISMNDRRKNLRNLFEYIPARCTFILGREMYMRTGRSSDF